MNPFNFSSRPLLLVYLGRILILVGMVMVFGGISAIVARYLCQGIFHVDVFHLDTSAVRSGNNDARNALMFFQTLAGGIGLFLIPALVFPRAIDTKVNRMVLYAFKPSWKVLVLSLFTVFCSTPFISWLYELNQLMHFPSAWADYEVVIRNLEDQSASLSKIFVTAETVPQLLTNIFVVALVPAICEEFFFRGILLQYTRFIFASSWMAILVSAILFSGFHGQFYGFLPRAALGVMLGYLFLNTGSIWVPVSVHFLNNALAVLADYFEKRAVMFQIFDADYVFPWYAALASLGITIYVCYLVSQEFLKGIQRRFPNYGNTSEPHNPQADV